MVPRNSRCFDFWDRKRQNVLVPIRAYPFRTWVEIDNKCTMEIFIHFLTSERRNTAKTLRRGGGGMGRGGSL